MGFFGKLFEKKVCDVCGEDIGLLGNRKLEDGNLCKECAKKLSPWFSDRRESTVAEIKAQLEYREANKEAVSAFHTTRTLGSNTKVLLDEDACKFMVTGARDLEAANPDVLDFSQVTGCEVNVRESKSEVYREVRDPEGGTKRESYSPRRYKYSYCFAMTIHVNHPYFDEINFDVSPGYVQVETSGRDSRPMFRPGSRPGVRPAPRMEGSPTPPTNAERHNDYEYRRYEDMAEEIRQALTQVREQVREEAREAAAPKTACTCPWCGATTMPDANGCCEYCGGSLNG